MSFDWEMFAGKFLNKMTEGIKERKEKAEDFKEKQEAAAERNAQLVRQRQTNSRLAAEFMRKSRALGASDAQLEVALASGKSGVEDFYNQLQSRANSLGQSKLSPDEIAAFTNMPTLPSVSASEPFDIDLMAQQTYGVRQEGLPKPPEDDTSFMGKLFGVDAKDRVKRELAQTDYMDGLSIAEINALARQDDYQSQFPGATMTFLDVPIFKSTDALTFSENLLDVMEQSVEDNELRIRNAKLNPPEGVDPLTAESEMAQTVKEEAALSFIESYAETYQHGGFLDSVVAAKSIIAAIGGKEFEKILDSFLVEPSPEIAELIKKDKEKNPDDDGGSEGGGSEGGGSEGGGSEGGGSEGGPDPEEEALQAKKEELLGLNFPKRPPSTKILSARAWDKKYGGKVDPETRKAIIVEPRPPEGQGERAVEYMGTTQTIDDADRWDQKYAKTHFPNGLPKL